FLYVTLLCGMVVGSLVWGAARFVLAGLSGSTFPFSAFLAGAVTNAVPGIILHIVLIPALALALKRAGVLRDGGIS
ncbi:MAG: ECF transporter S component, partial [Oscillospiraceae bacterium]|nr:ECF transporter S component [Oscillospiraceae bacterium]